MIFFVKAKDVGLLEGFQAGHNGEMITHLQFLNDIVLFCSAKWEELLVIKMFLRCFKLSLGLKINLVKSLLVGFDCQDELLASNLSCKVGKLPLIIYLGVPIGGKHKPNALWDPMVAKFERKLSSWKRNILSLGDRITLIKATLSNLLVYYMSLFKMSVAVRKRLYRIRRNFL